VVVAVPPVLQHLVDRFSEEERDFCPSPPKHAKNHLKDGKSKQHVRTVEKMLDEELDGDN